MMQMKHYIFLIQKLQQLQYYKVNQYMKKEESQKYKQGKQKQTNNQSTRADTKHSFQDVYSEIIPDQSTKSKSHKRNENSEEYTNFSATDEYTQLYKQFMSKVINESQQKLTIKNEQKLAALGIYILDYSIKQESQKKGKVSFEKEENGFQIIYFYVLVAGFKILLKGINIDQDYLPKMEFQGFDQGGFGICQKIKGSQGDLCIKAIKNYKQNKQTENIYRKEQFKCFKTEQHLLQIGLMKLASALEIAPQFHKFKDEYDFICYNDCTIFLTELCTPFQKYRAQQQNKNKGKLPKDFNQRLQMQIGKCLLRLHLQKIVHHDVKPQNIVFSQKKKEFVLVDLGVARAYPQTHLYVTKLKSISGGTIGFVPQEVQKVFFNKKNIGSSQETIDINVYYLDVFALKNTLQWDNYGSNYFINKKLQQQAIEFNIPNDNPNQQTKQKFMKRTIGYDLETLQKLIFNNSNISWQTALRDFLKKYNKNNQQVYQLYQSQGKIKQAIKHYLLIMCRCQNIQEKYQNKQQKEINKLKNRKTVMTLNSLYRLSKLMRQTYKPGYLKYQKMFETIIQKTLNKDEISFDFYFLIKDILHFHRGVLQGEPIIDRIKKYYQKYIKDKNISNFVKYILQYILILNPRNSQKYRHIIQYVWQILQGLFQKHDQIKSQIAVSSKILMGTYYPTTIEQIQQCRQKSQDLHILNRKLRLDALIYIIQAQHYLIKKEIDKSNQIYHTSLDVLKSGGWEQSLSASFIKSGIGVNYISQKDYQKAQMYLNQALYIRKVLLGKKNMRFLVVLFNLVRVHNERGIGNKQKSASQFQKADKYYQEIIEILKDIPKEDLKRQLYYLLSGIFESYLKATVFTKKFPVQIFNQRFLCLALASYLYFLRDYQQKQEDIIQMIDKMFEMINNSLKQPNGTGKQKQLGKQHQNQNINRKQSQFLHFYAVASRLHIELIFEYKTSNNKSYNKLKYSEYMGILQRNKKLCDEETLEIIEVNKKYQKDINENPQNMKQFCISEQQMIPLQYLMEK